MRECCWEFLFYCLPRKLEKHEISGLPDLRGLTHLIEHGFIVAPQAGSSRAGRPTLGVLKSLGCAPLGPHSVTVKGFVCHHFSSVDGTDSVLQTRQYSQVSAVHPYPTMQHSLTLEKWHQQNVQPQP